MNPRTIQQVNDIGCCDCAFPTCPPPRMECESIGLQMCGMQVPWEEGMPTEAACDVYYEAVHVIESDWTNNSEDSQFIDTETGSNYDEFVCKAEPWDDDENVCVGSPKTSINRGSVTKNTYDKTNAREHFRSNEDWDCSGEYEQGNSVPMHCDGTYFYTYKYWDADEVTYGGDCSEYRPCYVWYIPGVGQPTCNVPVFGDGYVYTRYDDRSDFVRTGPLDAPLDGTWSESHTYKFLTIGFILSELAAKEYPSDVPSCSAHLHLDNVCDAPSSAQKFRYRFAPPAEYLEAESLHATWEMQWDVVSASRDWWAWFDGGMVGTEPTPGPSAIGDPREWTWDPEGDEWSPWYYVDAPSTEGEIRVVNIISACWNHPRIGTKPTAYGDQIAL